MEENISINANVVNAIADGASAGITKEAAPATTATLIKEIVVNKPKRGFFDYIIIGLRAYCASLFECLMVVPIVASAVTIGLYFSSPPIAPGWQPVVFGALFTCIAWLLISVFVTYFSTFEGGNARSYGLLTTRLRQLEARLDEIDSQTSHGKSKKLAEYQLVALEEAKENFADLKNYLYKFPAGLQWALALGYINAWGKLHRAEEALIEVEPVEVVIREALHDKLAIQGSRISNRDELLKKLRQAVKELNPAMESRFKTYRPEEDNEEIRELKKAVKKIAAKVGIDLDDNLSDKGTENQVIKAEAEASARLTMREVRRVLNDFRDHLWEGLIRARNQLASTIFTTGVGTYLLLLYFILAGNPTKDEYLAAAVFYMVGALAGLLGRIYRESRISTAIDDYGLSLARLVANLLLSGLAGIGGVLLYGTILPPIMSSTSTAPLLANVFVLNRLEFIIAAATFGLAPNLIIRSLQQRSERYISALKSSKGTEADMSGNAN